MYKNKPTFKEGIPSADRARQFIPFMALKGYFEICRSAEHTPEPRHALTEEEQLELSQKISSLRRHDMVRVIHYNEDAYIETKGILSEIVPELRYLRVIKTRIDFDNILRIEAEGSRENSAKV